jgi:hypothetical protein
MKQLLLLFVLSALCATPVCAVPGPHSVPPASFLDFHVDNVPQLTFEVAYDKTVQARLAHHFHLSGPAMCRYVSRNLVLSHLKSPEKMRVYCITPTGREYYVVMTLPKGAAVFAQRYSGKPVLRLVCGNPLVAALPALPPLAATNVASPVKTAVESALEQQITPTVADSPVFLNAGGLAEVAAPVINTVGAGEVVVTAAGSSLGWLPLAGGAFAGAIAQQTNLFTNSGGGGGTFPSGPTPNGPSPAPEPSPCLVLVLGGMGLAAARYLRRASATRVTE